MTGTAHRPMCPIGVADHFATQQFRRGVADGANACAWDTEHGPECGSGPLKLLLNFPGPEGA